MVARKRMLVQLNFLFQKDIVMISIIILPVFLQCILTAKHEIHVQ
jgi:hypothetical protein